MAVQARYTIVVRRDQPDLYRALVASTVGDEMAQVILDRRQRDRRVILRDVDHDRRRRPDRRSVPDAMWGARGFLVARTYRTVRSKPGNGFHNCLELPAPTLGGAAARVPIPS
jgi:hypothetical protein